jgi:hypothetical protein
MLAAYPKAAICHNARSLVSKSPLPALAVALLNLVPACSDCNKAKLASVPTSAEEVGLHPITTTSAKKFGFTRE